MSRVVFLLEEYSMKILLEGLLPRLVPELTFLCISHGGKHDLEKSIPRKLRAWREPRVRFVIIRDNDGGDCRLLKQQLLELCKKGGRTDSLIRIPCQELEAWYFGQPEALEEAYPETNIKAISRQAKYRNPDAIQRPSAKLASLIPEFQKVMGARRMGKLLAIEGSRSQSFNVFVTGVRQIAADLAADATAESGDD